MLRAGSAPGVCTSEGPEEDAVRHRDGRGRDLRQVDSLHGIREACRVRRPDDIESCRLSEHCIVAAVVKEPAGDIPEAVAVDLQNTGVRRILREDPNRIWSVVDSIPGDNRAAVAERERLT